MFIFDLTDRNSLCSGPVSVALALGKARAQGGATLVDAADGGGTRSHGGGVTWGNGIRREWYPHKITCPVVFGGHLALRRDILRGNNHVPHVPTKQPQK